MGRLQDKVAIVTGAASEQGLGAAIARRFAEEGAKVVVTDIEERGVQACAAGIVARGGQAIAWRQDATDEEEWTRTIERTLATWGRLDVLVNNAGIAVLKPIEEFTLADYERQMRVNMTSVFLGTRAALPAMRRGGGGSIVNMSSVAGLVGVPGVSVYAASKAGVKLFSKSVALECAKERIRCNSVHPGLIDTDMQRVALRDNPGQYEVLNASVPMGYMGEPLDIANCVLFLASDEAKYITGAEFVVDGGLIAQ